MVFGRSEVRFQDHHAAGANGSTTGLGPQSFPAGLAASTASFLCWSPSRQAFSEVRGFRAVGINRMQQNVTGCNRVQKGLPVQPLGEKEQVVMMVSKQPKKELNIVEAR